MTTQIPSKHCLLLRDIVHRTACVFGWILGDRYERAK